MTARVGHIIEARGTLRLSVAVHLDLTDDCVVAIGGVAQKNQAQDGHAVFRQGKLGVGAEIIGDIPEIGFQI